MPKIKGTFEFTRGTNTVITVTTVKEGADWDDVDLKALKEVVSLLPIGVDTVKMVFTKKEKED